MEQFKTEYQLAIEKREMAIYHDFNELAAVPGNSKIKICEHLCQKYELHSVSTIYNIRKRVASRLGAAGNQ